MNIPPAVHNLVKLSTSSFLYAGMLFMQGLAMLPNKTMVVVMT